MEAKTHVLDDMVVCVLRDGFTAIEQTMVDSGESDRIVAIRHDFQRMMSAKFTGVVEELTGRKVAAFLSQAHIEPDLTLEVFFVDGPLDGFGTTELIPDES